MAAMRQSVCLADGNRILIAFCEVPQGCQTWDLNFNPQERLVLLFLLVLNPGQPINAVFFEEM